MPADRAAVEAALLECYSFARSLAFMLTRNAHEADDLVQECVAQALRRPPGSAEVPAMRAWLRTALVRESMRRSRRLASEIKMLGRIFVEPPPAPATSGASSDVLAALRKLAPRRRAAVVLRYVYDLSEDQIAAELGVAPGTVKATLSQARDQLRGILGEN